MLELTAENILLAYLKTGLKPKDGHYFPEQGCACPLGALYVMDTGCRAGYDKDDKPNNWSEKLFGVITRSSFARGFDGQQLRIYPTDNDVDENAYNLGVRMRKLLLDKD